MNLEILHCLVGWVTLLLVSFEMNHHQLLFVWSLLAIHVETTRASPAVAPHPAMYWNSWYSVHEKFMWFLIYKGLVQLHEELHCPNAEAQWYGGSSIGLSIQISIGRSKGQWFKVYVVSELCWVLSLDKIPYSTAITLPPPPLNPGV